MRYRFLRYPEGKTKAVTFSYDDGCKQDLRTIQILDRYGMKGTFNLNSYKMRGNSGLSEAQVKEEVLAKGHEIAVHGANHAAEGVVRPIEGIQDVLSCRLELEEKYDRIIRGMAYPDSGVTMFANGTTYQNVKSYLSQLDIAYARSLRGDNNSFALPTDWHAWMPTAHHNHPEILNWIDEFLELDLSKKVSSCRRNAGLFYIWGHSYEFDNDQNWDHLETICQKFSACEDIWYATNMEIYEYVNAYYSLVYSADGTKVYNPTLFKVWFDVDGTQYAIEPGQTITIG